MANYVSQYTGAQIDEYLGKAAISVPNTRTINEFSLSDDIVLTANSVGAVDGATGQGSAVRISNRNLLDNAYWAAQEAIINQRGATSYTTAGYGIDRWILSVGNNISLTINDGYVHLEKIVATGYPMMVQYIDPTIYNTLVGKNVTLSALTTEGLFFNTFTIPEDSYDLTLFNLGSTEFYCNFQQGTSLPAFRIISKGSAVVGSFVNLIAAKLELGSVSTLAHQENGVWVLNDPPPNYAEELAKCQRYYQLYTSAAQRPTNGADCRPVMRIANPIQGTIAISGTTYYFNDANL